MSLDINIRKEKENLSILSIKGRITAATAMQLKTEIKSLLETGTVNLVLDLQEVEFIDSSGLSAIVSGLKQVREIGGSLKLAGMKTEVQSIFKLTMLDKVFEIYPSAEAALSR